MGILDVPGIGKVAADARYGKAGPLPAGLVAANAANPAVGVNVYNATQCAYNFTPLNTMRLRWSLGRALSGVGIARWAFVGDSTTAGFATGDTANLSWPVQLRKLFAARGYPIDGTGPVVGNPGGAAATMVDTRYTYTGTWTAQGGGSTSNNFVKTGSSTGATVRFISDRAGTVARIAYFCTTTATYSIDGAAAVTLPATSGTALSVVTVTGLTNTAHTIIITTSSAANFNIAYMEVCNNVAGLSFANFGTNSTRTADWTNSTYYYPGTVALGWLPHVTFIDLGINDKNVGAGVDVATFKASYQTLITSFRQGNASDVILLTNNPNQSGDFSDYQQAKYELADANNVPLLDLNHRWGASYATATQKGLTADGAHPDNEGYADKASAVFAAIMG